MGESSSSSILWDLRFDVLLITEPHKSSFGQAELSYEI